MSGAADMEPKRLLDRLSQLPAEKRALVEKLLSEKRDTVARVAEIPRRTASNTAPLSYAQQRMWFLSRLYPDSAALNCDFAIRLRVDYNVAVLERSLNEVVRRHEALRTRISERDGEPVQDIQPFLAMPLVVVDLSKLPQAEREAEALRLSAEEARTPFDLERGPLLRTKLLRLGDDDYVLLITVHHIVADYSSMLIFFTEVKKLYMSYSYGLPYPLEGLPFQYADFAIWQRQQFQGGVLRAQLDYWKRQLAGLPKLRLPADRPYTATTTWEGARVTADLPPALMAEVRRLGQAEDCTFFMTALAGFQALLNRYTDQEDFAVGVPIANRTRPGTDQVIGFFVNSLVMRSRFGRDITFRELLRQVRQTAREAFANQDLPFEHLVEEIHPERDTTQHPIFQVAFQTLPVPQAAPEASRMGIERGTATIDLAFEIEERPEAPILRIEYSTKLFNEDSMTRMAGHYRRLLESAVHEPDRPIATLPILGDAERRRLLVESNRTAAAFPYTACLHHLVEQQVERTPNAIAIGHGNHSVTYAELNDRAQRLAGHLAGHGIGAERLVGVCVQRSVEMVIALLGILKAGGGYLPLDPSYPEGRLRFLIEDSGIDTLITERALAPALRSCEIRKIFVDDEPSWPAATAVPAKSEVGAQNLAYVIYTSGSTGQPKGVMVDHRAIVNQLCWMQQNFSLAPGDTVVQKYSVTFDTSILEIFGPLISGARLVLAEPGREGDCPYLLDLMAREQVTVLDTVPSLAELLVESGLQQKCPALRMITCGGEVMPTALLERLRHTPGLQINNMYGPTEATITALAWTDSGQPLHTSVPIGRPVANTRIYILDSVGNPTPIGVPGELHIGGDCLARGYLRRPELESARFVPDPFCGVAGARMFRTGDVARYLPDGSVEFLGRADQQVKLRGYRIELGEIESVLGQHPSIEQCVVTEQRGAEGGARLVAYVVPREQAIELWPSVGEYFVYDELLYYAMTTDERRNAAYRQAIGRAVRGKVVADLGTGGDAIQARLCVEAGARRVYAIEMLESAYQQAATLVRRLGLEDRIIVLHADTTTVQLPEPVDLCVSELIGTIGSSEGAIPLLNNARRLLVPGGSMIPERSVTRIAAVSLPDAVRSAPRFTELSAHYAEKVFEKMGRVFDVRVNVKNLPDSSVVSDAAVFEALDFTEPVGLDASIAIELTIGRNCRLDGFLLWLNLYPGEHILIDVRQHQYSWLPVFFPAFSPPIEVRQGDVIQAVCERITPPDRRTPDYRIRGEVRRQSGVSVPFCYESRYEGSPTPPNPFYEALLTRPLAASAAQPARAGDRQVERWRNEYQELYAGTSDPADGAFNTVGWESTYTGAAIPEADMREQVEATVDRLRKLHPTRVLEIGAGTGLLLFPLLRHVEQYIATDFSPAALDYIRRHLPAGEAAKVQLLERTADAFAGLEPASFDLVVLNSVVQYFPSVEYLGRVLTGATRLLVPGGHLFIGDVRSLALLETFHASVELARAEPEVSIADLRNRLRRRLSQERELVLEPAFFATFGSRIPPFAETQVTLKRGVCSNELTRFRYDVLMRVGEASACDWEPQHRSWQDFGDVPSLVRFLRERQPPALIVADIPNGRIRLDVSALERLNQPDEGTSVAHLREAMREVQPGFEPEELWGLQHDLPYDVEVCWARSGVLDRMDAHFVSNAVRCGSMAAPLILDRNTAQQSLETFANAPAQQQWTEQLGSALRSHLRSLLPEYMVPSDFSVVRKIPLTSHGKVDRKALAESAQVSRRGPRAFVAPRTELEKRIADHWREVLHVEHVGLDDNFFDLGGHSLLLTKLHLKLRDSVGPQLTITELFRFPTVGALAIHLVASPPFTCAAGKGEAWS